MSDQIQHFKEKHLNTFNTTHLFFIFFLLFELLFLKSEVFSSIVYFIDRQDLAVLVIFFVYLTALQYALYKFFAISLNSDWKYKIIYFLFFSVAVFYEYGYQKALKRFSVYQDIENLFSTNLEHKIFATSSYFYILAIIPCLTFLLCLIFIRSKETPYKLKGFLVVSLTFVLYFGQLSYVNTLLLEKKTPIVSIDAFCLTLTDFALWGSFSNGILKEREILPKPPVDKEFKPKNNIVYIVDESTLGDHLSINGYERDTTPFLKELQTQGILHNWGIAAAATTGSHTTFDILISGLTPDDLPDPTNIKLFTSPNIFQYAKALNYKTHYFDGQMADYWGGIRDDRNYIDNFSGVRFDEGIVRWEIDTNIAKKVNKIISTSTGNFIFIFKHGNHIPYGINYPKEEEVWKPGYVTEDKYAIPTADKLDEVVNSYDNSVKYNLNSFFQNLIDDYSNIPNNSLIIYTGDHGQTLYANGMASHGGTTRKEATVPLFIIGNLEGEVDTKFKASHSNIFATVLDLMNYPVEFRKRNYALSLLKAKESDSKTRYFNPNKENKIPFD